MAKIYASKTNKIGESETRHAEISRRLARECVVLLENNGVLPLINTKSVALFGAGARNTIKGGTGSGEVNTRTSVNIEQGLEIAGISVTSKAWLDNQDKYTKKAYDDYMKMVKEVAARKHMEEFNVIFDNPFKESPALDITENDIDKTTDTALYIISRNSGEGADRFNAKGDYLPYDEEIEQIKFLGAHYDKLVVVLNIGGVMELKDIRAIDSVDAIILMSQLGNLGGEAICDVLFGNATPSGKLADTWAKNYMDYPSSAKFSHNESVHDEMYEDGIYMGYRYFDSFNVEPEYCFGYGLSYTEFDIDTKNVSVQNGQVNIEVNVKNKGEKYSGKEVVQVYISSTSLQSDHPYQTLVAYKKTSNLSPAESENITINFPINELAVYDEKSASWKIEAADYVVRIGNSSRNTKIAAILSVEKDATILKCKNLFTLDVELNEIKPDMALIVNRIKSEIPRDIPKIKIDTDIIKAQTVKYQESRKEYKTDKTKLLTLEDVKNGDCTVEELVSQLTVEEMATMCVGTSRSDNNSVVGNASAVVPGAAGDTSSILNDNRKVKNLILADGPAGLRLQPHFKTNLSGEVIPGGWVMSGVEQPFGDDVNESNSIDYYQYCTAIPIAWALAQSWNTELIYKAGDVVGLEMEQFGVDLWLAPALNIHRNPLCGRNFEYYSEDPLIAGKTAAFITKGVQSHKGKGTTIKHFAVNNQEDNRFFLNAHVSERTLREIYLKGFEIAVRESQPFSIMTSYNLLNGIHTANRYDLIQSLARDEWGFKGTVMTDWFTSQDVPAITGKFERKYPISASTGCIHAGNDIQMPGCQKNVDDIVEAVNGNKEIDGYRITKADLQYCTANILRVVAECSCDEDYI
jgi:beta-glucosidase